MKVYYNEFDPHAAAWLRNLMAAGLIPVGEVDERSIADVATDDLRGFDTCHFFAGIGGWSLALRLAGWPDDRPVWTGSCPCQPYSSAGKRLADADPRNLWPAFFRLIRECRPVVCFGEQVEGAIRHGWLDGVSADLEGEGYAVGSVVLGSHSVGSPHIRQRLFWVADAASNDEFGARQRRSSDGGEQQPTGGYGTSSGVGDAPSERRGEARAGDGVAWKAGLPSGSIATGGVGIANSTGWEPGRTSSEAARHGGAALATGSSGGVVYPGFQTGSSEQWQQRSEPDSRSRQPSKVGDHWYRSVLIPCRDGKARRVEPGLECLVDGLPFRLADGRTREGASRAAMLKGFGNAIVPQVAAEFVKAWLHRAPGVRA